MRFDYGVSLDNLLIEEKIDGGGAYQRPNRELIREMVQREHDYKDKVSKDGGNIHQAELDVNDAFVAILTNLPDSASRELVSGVHLEETLAFNNSILDRQHTEFQGKMDAQEKEIIESNNNQTIIQWCVVAVIVIVAIVVISNLK